MSQFVLATGGYDSTVRLFDAQNANLLRTFQFSDPAVLQLCFSGAGPVHASAEPLYLAVGGSPRVAVFDASSPATSGNALFVFEGHTHPITAVGFDPAIRPAFAYSASEDGTLQVWNPGLAPLPAVDDPLCGVLGGAPGDGIHGNYHHGDPQAGPQLNGNHAQPRQAQQPHTGARATDVIVKFDNKAAINAAVYDSSSKCFFTVDVAGRLRVWGLQAKKCLATLTPRATRTHLHIQTLEMTTNAAGAPMHLVLADIRGNVFVYTVESVIASIGADPAQPVALFNALDPTLRGKKTFVTRTRSSVDGTVLAITLSTGKIKIFDMPAVTRAGVPETPSQANRTPDASVQNKNLAPRISLPQNVPGHLGYVWDAVFVGDASNYIFTCGSDHQVILWNLDDGSPSDYPGHSKAVVCLAIKEQFASVGSLTSPPA